MNVFVWHHLGERRTVCLHVEESRTLGVLSSHDAPSAIEPEGFALVLLTLSCLTSHLFCPLFHSSLSLLRSISLSLSRSSRAAMENQVVFSALEAACEDAKAALMRPTSFSDTEATSRLLESVRLIEGHGRALQPVVRRFTTVFHHFDLDPQTPANGYRTLVKVLWLFVS